MRPVSKEDPRNTNTLDGYLMVKVPRRDLQIILKISSGERRTFPCQNFTQGCASHHPSAQESAKNKLRAYYNEKRLILGLFDSPRCVFGLALFPLPSEKRLARLFNNQ